MSIPVPCMTMLHGEKESRERAGREQGESRGRAGGEQGESRRRGGQIPFLNQYST